MGTFGYLSILDEANQAARLTVTGCDLKPNLLCSLGDKIMQHAGFEDCQLSYAAFIYMLMNHTIPSAYFLVIQTPPP